MSSNLKSTQVPWLVTFGKWDLSWAKLVCVWLCWLSLQPPLNICLAWYGAHGLCRRVSLALDEERGNRTRCSGFQTHLCCLCWVISSSLQTKHNLCLPQAPLSDWWQAAGYLDGLLWSVDPRDWHKPFAFCQLIHLLPRLLHTPRSKDTLLLQRDKIH